MDFYTHCAVKDFTANFWASQTIAETSSQQRCSTSDFVVLHRCRCWTQALNAKQLALSTETRLLLHVDDAALRAASETTARL